ncbi:MAG: type II toxin-antitoxin system MqsA family antitoxin [Candidatus Latescibacteria bacterium]|jgi:putative zinc finger/helix-turn-helix YgiT family protein|nr:type II toxin-antitoxin system MqsA family antitoxin [Candidatus Latescibacterota bacterium]
MSTIRYREYPCPECGKGTILPTRIQNYKTRIKGYPFVVDEAVIGICDQCGTKTFNAKEMRRWEKKYQDSVADQFLSPDDIVDLREKLGLSMEDFARLTGTTRQSIHNWEKARLQPSRMADLMMRLVKESYVSGKVDVISFLLDEAEKMGVTIELQRCVEQR